MNTRLIEKRLFLKKITAQQDYFKKKEDDGSKGNCIGPKDYEDIVSIYPSTASTFQELSRT